jgi:creatinine amidohydrolase
MPFHMPPLLRHALICATLLLATQASFAQTPKTVFLEELTWTELRDQVAAGKTTVLVPIGGTEQSGPYVALGKHNARAKVLAQRIAEGLGNALVAPVVAYVPEGSTAPPSAHMRFAGTISVPDDVFKKMLESAAHSFQVHGFKNIVFLGDHGGYTKDLQQVAAQLNKSWSATQARAWVPAEYYGTSSDGYNQILRQRGYRDDEIGTHAALADTALQLAVAPDMVRLQQLRNAPKPSAADGVYGGDPRRASAEIGILGVDAIVAKTVQALKTSTNPH